MNQLIDLLKTENVCTLLELVEKTGMSEEMILARLERYEQLGLVKRCSEKAGSCEGRCGSCKGCGNVDRSENPMIFWRVME